MLLDFIKTESDLLNEGNRAKIMEAIKSSENKARKDSAYKRYEVYKDRTFRYVAEKMLLWFDRETVGEMAYAISNISLERKIVDKLARVYSQGVTRTVGKDDATPDDKLSQDVEELAKLLKMNTAMKKTNRAYKRDKNAMAYIKPYKCIENNQEMWDIEICTMFPYLYDVIQDPNNKSKPLAVILSHYCPPPADLLTIPQNENQAGIHTRGTSADSSTLTKSFTPSDKVDNEPEYSENENQVIWWSNNYHFTTDLIGKMQLGQDGNDNPIGELPFTNFAEDQDGEFWATGGDDLVDGSILVNCLISHMNHIAVVQGYGQFYMTGANLPRYVKVGPSKAICLEHGKEDPTPQLGFLQSTPPLTELKENIEMYVAMLLTTNNLSVSGLATNLGNSQAPAAGISLIIDKAESMEDVNDQQQIFHDNEPSIWVKIAKWMNLYKGKGLLVKRLAEYDLPEDVQVQLKFPDPAPIMTEKEKLDNLKARQDLGISTTADLITMDNPQLTKDQAKSKVSELTQERAQKIKLMAGATNGGPNNQGNQGGGQPNQNNLDHGAGPNGDPAGEPQ